ncbi:MAG: hypothetical protein JSV24_05435 [Bacteroidales bacterium]|nr:MAG: hypothetical protein JSV24_05435 [Bacteroidales bacterium]
MGEHEVVNGMWYMNRNIIALKRDSILTDYLLPVMLLNSDYYRIRL